MLVRAKNEARADLTDSLDLAQLLTDERFVAAHIPDDDLEEEIVVSADVVALHDLWDVLDRLSKSLDGLLLVER